jgi:hypothetical protein
MISMSVSECVSRLKRLRDECFPMAPHKPYGPVVRGIYRGLFQIQEYCITIVGKQWSIGKRIWGEYDLMDSNLTRMIHPTKIVMLGEDYKVGMFAMGLPAMLESGGKTKPHFIRPKKARFQTTRKLSTAELSRWRVRRANKTLVGEGVLKIGDRYVRLVQRHTARIPKKPYIGPYMRAADIYIAPMIEKALEGAARRLDG